MLPPSSGHKLETGTGYLGKVEGKQVSMNRVLLRHEKPVFLT
jgi:hypothetical protein